MQGNASIHAWQRGTLLLAAGLVALALVAPVKAQGSLSQAELADAADRIFDLEIEVLNLDLPQEVRDAVQGAAAPLGDAKSLANAAAGRGAASAEELRQIGLALEAARARLAAAAALDGTNRAALDRIAGELAALRDRFGVTGAVAAAGPEQGPGCAVVSAEALSGAVVRLTWGAVANASGFSVLRDGEVVATLPANATSFEDRTLAAGETARYAVAATGVDPSTCATVEVTAIPFFPHWAGLILAAAGTLGGFLWMRRRAA